MLQNLSDRIRLCYERAAEAREQADAALDPEAKFDFMTMERRWLLLARSYELGERLDDFVRALPKLDDTDHLFDPHYAVQASGAAVYMKDTKSRMKLANPSCLKIIGKNWNELHGRNDLQWHSDRVQARAVLSNDKGVIESKQTQVYEELFDTPLGRRIILSTKAPLLDADGEVVGIVGVSKDITERKNREDHAEQLQNELRHRMKNTLSVVQALARASMRETPGYSQFESRLLAYARSQDLLLGGGGMVTMHQLVQAHREALAIGDRFQADGHDVNLPAVFAIEIGIALHELATNSIKYGALGGEGRVEIVWQVETRDDRRFVVLEWNERHDRLQLSLGREGFGHKVLTRTVGQRLNGVASYEITPGRVRWSLRAELPTERR